MISWEKQPNYFRLFITGLSVLFLFFIVFNFIRNASVVSDENYFTRTPANIYFNTNINSNPVNTKNINLSSNLDETGNLLLQVNEKNVTTVKEVLNIIKNSNDSVTFKLYNTQKKIEYSVRVFPKDLPDDYLSEIKFGALITQIIKEGASDRAGLKEGDIIISINDKTFQNIFEADRYMRSYSVGSSIKYTILRNGYLLDFSIQLAKFGVPFRYLLMFVYGVIVLFLGLLLGFIRPRLKPARLLSIMMILLGFILNDSIFKPSTDIFEITRVLLSNIAVFMTLPVVFHVSLYFPYENNKPDKKRWLILCPYIISMLMIVLVCIQIFIGYNTGNVYFLLYVIFMIFYYMIFLGIYDHTGENQKTSAKLLIHIANALLMLIFLIGTLRTIVFENFISIAGIFDVVDYVRGLLVIVIPIIYFFVISNYHLLDIRFRIKRNIQYYMVNSLWQFSIFALMVLSLWFLTQLSFIFPNLHITGTGIEVLDTPMTADLQMHYEKLFLVFISIGLTFLLVSFRKRIKAGLNVKFHRSDFDYRKASTELTEILTQNMSVDNLAKSIINELVQLIHLKRIGMIIFKNEERVFELEFSGFKCDDLKEICRATGFKFVESLRDFKSEFRVEYLPEPLKSVLKEFEFAYVVPIKSKEKIVGVLLLGEKMSEVAYTFQDFEFLSSITGQIAVSVENSFLVGELAHQERIKHELEIARRIQLASLPQTIPHIEGLDVSGISLPALEVGGDFYDYLEGGPSALTIIIGDVSGKGTSAALYMSKIQGIIRTLHEFDLHPRKLLISANQLLHKYLERSYFITAIGAHFNSKNHSVQLARAGHLPLYYFNNKSKSIEIITSKGMALGFTKDSLFDRNLEEININFESGDVFVFVTDGVIEARNPMNIEYGDEKLIKIIQNKSEQSSEEIRDSIIESVRTYAGDADQYDDLTVVIVKIQ